MIKEISVNRKAYYDYFILETLEAGLVLCGSEIKSIRKGKAQIKDSFISFIKNEAYIKGMHIAEYKEANIFNHDEVRERKLLLHRKEIIRLETKVKLDGLTIIPLKLYLKDGLAKIQIALCQGKKLHDKRLSDKIKTMEREIKGVLRRWILLFMQIKKEEVLEI